MSEGAIQNTAKYTCEAKRAVLFYSPQVNLCLRSIGHPWPCGSSVSFLICMAIRFIRQRHLCMHRTYEICLTQRLAWIECRTEDWLARFNLVLLPATLFCTLNHMQRHETYRHQDPQIFRTSHANDHRSLNLSKAIARAPEPGDRGCSGSRMV